MTLLARLRRLKSAGATFSLDPEGDGFEYDGPEDVLTDAVLEELRAQQADVPAALRELEVERRELEALQERARAHVESLDLSLIEVPLTPEQVAAIPSGSLYVSEASKREPGPPTSPTRAALAPVRHVSHVEREPRHRMQPMKDSDRVCAACGARGPSEGPMPRSWDWHLVRGQPALVGTCSAPCRAAKGFRERWR
jgi:hypothetical protein